MRRVLVMILTAVTTAVVARKLGGVEFGVYGSAFGLSQLLIALSDFGFSLVLGRDLASDQARAPRLLWTVLWLQTFWCVALTLVLVGFAAASGFGTVRGQVLLALSPSVALYGLSSVRQYFVVRFDVRYVAKMDIAVNVAMSVGVVAVVLATSSAVAVAATYTAGGAVLAIVIAHAGLRRAGSRHRPTRSDHADLIRRALPLGAISILSSFYFTIDVALLGWLISGRSLGNYVAAVKILSLLVALPTLLMTAALPGLTLTAESRERMSRLASTIVHWLAAACLPFCVATMVFAPTVVKIALGSQYDGAIGLMRILAGAAAVSCMANVLGMSYVALRRTRPQLISNAVALVFNVVGNIVLAPRYGVVASAWLTLATEVLVAVWAVVALRDELDFRAIAAPARVPVIASAALGLAGLALSAWPALAIPASAAVFLAIVSVFRGWPSEFRRRRVAAAV